MPINYKEHASLVELEEGIVTMKWMNCKFHSAVCYAQEFDASYHNLMPPERVSKHSYNVARWNRSSERFNRYYGHKYLTAFSPVPRHIIDCKDCSTPQIKFHIIKVPKRKTQAKGPGFYFYEGGYKLRRNYASSFQGVTATRKYLYFTLHACKKNPSRDYKRVSRADWKGHYL